MYFHATSNLAAGAADNQLPIEELKYYSELQKVSGILSLMISLVNTIVFVAYLGIMNADLSLTGGLVMFLSTSTCVLCAINVITGFKQRQHLTEEPLPVAVADPIEIA